MGTISQVPENILYVVGLASSFVTYPGSSPAPTGTSFGPYSTYVAAQAAALIASTAASTAPSGTSTAYYTARVEEAVTSPGSVNLYMGNPETWIIQAATVATYYPKSTAEVQAYSVSASNSNGQVLVARVFQSALGP